MSARSAEMPLDHVLLPSVVAATEAVPAESPKFRKVKKIPLVGDGANTAAAPPKPDAVAVSNEATGIVAQKPVAVADSASVLDKRPAESMKSAGSEDVGGQGKKKKQEDAAVDTSTVAPSQSPAPTPTKIRPPRRVKSVVTSTA